MKFSYSIDPDLMPDIEPAASPERLLWASALFLLIDDAYRHHQGKKVNGHSANRDYEAEAAFDDVMKCGVMLRYLCLVTGNNAAYLTRRFRQLVAES